MTSTIIGLLMLAVSLLQAVRDNPNLPAPIQAQAVAFATQVLAEATLEMAPAPQPILATPIPDIVLPAPQAATSTPQVAAPTCPLKGNDPNQVIVDNGNGRYSDAATGIWVDPKTGLCI